MGNYGEGDRCVTGVGVEGGSDGGVKGKLFSSKVMCPAIIIFRARMSRNRNPRCWDGYPRMIHGVEWGWSL